MPERAEPHVSVIVPIYNVDAFVRPCIESLITQSWKSLEILLVDDGSTDASGLICDEYADIDDRITVLHQPNAGLSAARNTGINAATSPLLLCVDGDDALAPDHIERLVRAFDSPGVDIATAGYVAVEPARHFAPMSPAAPQPTEILPRAEALVRLFHQRGVTNSAWGKLYRATLFEGIRYPVGALYEDLPVTYRLFAKARAVALTHDKTYFYVQRSSSITAQKQLDRRMDAVRFAAEALAEIEPLGEDVMRAARSRIFMESVFYLSEVADARAVSTVPLEVMNPIRMHRREVLCDCDNRPSTRAFALFAYAGPRAVRLLARARIQIHRWNTHKNSK